MDRNKKLEKHGTAGRLKSCGSFCFNFRLKVESPDKTATMVYPPPPPECGGMQSLRKLYRIGSGPSSSHTMGPMKAATQFAGKYTQVKLFQATFYGSLAATGVGHFTDFAVKKAFDPVPVHIVWKPDVFLERHPNAMKFEAFDVKGGTKVDAKEFEKDDKFDSSLLVLLGSHVCYSVGGGAVIDDASESGPPGSALGAIHNVYERFTMRQLLEWENKNGKSMSEYVYESEGREEMRNYLSEVWNTMLAAIERGVTTQGTLPGGIGLRRKARSFFLRSQVVTSSQKRSALIFAYALAVAEENAALGRVVTAPTCGSCGVVPAVLKYLFDTLPGVREVDILDALAVAGLAGNVVKTNASISGAEAGCQAEVGTATAMAAMAAVLLMGGTSRQAEYAAEIAIEHSLGNTCDPVNGLVQIPCIERNALAATRALDCADYAMMVDGTNHKISFDEAVLTLKITGIDINAAYRETALGGLATSYDLDERLEERKEKLLREVNRVRGDQSFF